MIQCNCHFVFFFGFQEFILYIKLCSCNSICIFRAYACATSTSINVNYSNVTHSLAHIFSIQYITRSVFLYVLPLRCLLYYLTTGWGADHVIAMAVSCFEAMTVRFSSVARVMELECSCSDSNRCSCWIDMCNFIIELCYWPHACLRVAANARYINPLNNFHFNLKWNISD